MKGTYRRNRRRQYRRRESDRFTIILQRVVLGTGAVGVIYGQAEMLGEPWRHILAVGCVLVLVVVAIWMKVT